jgi:hypothetical protein
MPSHLTTTMNEMNAKLRTQDVTTRRAPPTPLATTNYLESTRVGDGTSRKQMEPVIRCCC